MYFVSRVTLFSKGCKLQGHRVTRYLPIMYTPHIRTSGHKSAARKSYLYYVTPLGYYVRSRFVDAHTSVCVCVLKVRVKVPTIVY